MAGIVVVFDFDRTIIDVDSDDWVVDECGETPLFHQLLPTMSYNSLIDRMMKELHSHGRTIDDIAECLKRVPLNPHIAAAIKSAYSLGCELKILSDANVFFIETVLKHHGLREYFSEIITNPSFIDQEGRLRISPYHDHSSSPHEFLNVCPSNMCKGLLMEGILSSASASAQGKKRFIYLGDGKGDFCPSLRLGEGDYVMPRKNYPVWELIESNRLRIRAGVHEWCDGEELEKILNNLIKTITNPENDKNNTSQLFSITTDCKLQTMAVSTHAPLPRISAIL